MPSEAAQAGEIRPPGFGEMARGFTVATDDAYDFSFDVAAGRWTVLMFFGSLAQAASLQAVQQVLDRRDLFGGGDAAFYGVSLDPADRARGAADGAPVLVMPRVLEPQLCASLVDHYRTGAPRFSGFAMTRDGRTVEQVDPDLKRRRDVVIQRDDLVAAVDAGEAVRRANLGLVDFSAGAAAPGGSPR